MAAIVLVNAYTLINAVDLSDHVRSVTINYGAEIKDKSAMSIATRAKLAGLKDWSVNIEFNQDYASAKVDATLFPLVGAAAFAIEIRPDAGASSPTNPKYTGNALLETYPPLSGSIGEVNTTSVTLQGDGTLTRTAV